MSRRATLPAAPAKTAPYRPPNILTLPGVQLSSFVAAEDLAEERWAESAGEAEGRPASPAGGAPAAEEETYDRIPKVFTCPIVPTGERLNWPESTNLRCWSCGFTFDGPPKFVPSSFCEVDKCAEFGVEGNMCTFNCAARWIVMTARSMADQVRASARLVHLYYFFTGRRVLRIEPAPCRTELREYGGSLDREAFWRRLRELDPVAGLRDHTPGTVLPERLRQKTLWELAAPATPAAEARAEITVRPKTTPSAAAEVSEEDFEEWLREAAAEGEAAEGEAAEGEAAEGEDELEAELREMGLL